MSRRGESHVQKLARVLCGFQAWTAIQGPLYAGSITLTADMKILSISNPVLKKTFNVILAAENSVKTKLSYKTGKE
jgi:hypothetical protein